MGALSQLKPLFVVGITVGLVVAIGIARYAWSKLERRWFAPAVAFMGLSLATVSFLLCDPPELFADFNKAYYPGALEVLHGRFDVFTELIRSRNFVNLPVVALLFAPFALLPKLAAGLVFLVIGVAGTLLAFRWLAEAASLEGEKKGLLFLVLAGNGPLIYSLREGNTTHLILLCLVGVMFLLRNGRELVAGLLLGLCAVIKPPLLLLGVYFALRLRWKAALGGAITVGAACLVSVIVFGWELHVIWYERCIRSVLTSPVLAFNSQSFSAFYNRLATPDVNLGDWRTVPHHALAAAATRLSTLLLLGLAFVAAIYPSAKRPGAVAKPLRLVRETEYAMAIMLAFLLTGLAWTHYYLLALLPFAFFLSDTSGWPSDRVNRWLIWGGILLSAPPVKVLAFDAEWMQALYSRALVSHPLLGGVLIFVALLRSRARLFAAEDTSVTPARPGMVAESASR